MLQVETNPFADLQSGDVTSAHRAYWSAGACWSRLPSLDLVSQTNGILALEHAKPSRRKWFQEITKEKLSATVPLSCWENLHRAAGGQRVSRGKLKLTVIDRCQTKHRSLLCICKIIVFHSFQMKKIQYIQGFFIFNNNFSGFTS